MKIWKLNHLHWQVRSRSSRWKWNSTVSGISPIDIDNDADQQNEGEDVQDLDTLVAELKESVTRFQTENERLKKELEASQIGIEAERKLHRQELPKVDEAYVPEDAERNMKEMEYLIHTYGIHIENERDYFRQVLNPK